VCVCVCLWRGQGSEDGGVKALRGRSSGSICDMED
jgi:hypothetical protein